MNRKQTDDEMELDLLELLKALWRKAFLIILIGVVFAAAAYIGAKMLIAPTYCSEFTAYVNNKTEDATTLNSSDVSAAQSLANTYSEIISSYTVLDAAAHADGEGVSAEDLADDVTVDIASNTQIITVSVIMDSPEEAYTVANAMKDFLPEYGAQIVEGSSLKIIDAPRMPKEPYGPNCVKIAVIGFLLGFLMMCVIIIVQFMMDTVVKSETTLQDTFGIAVIGIIPNLHDAAKAGAKYGYGYGHSRSKKK